MKITGTVLNIELSNITFSNLKGKEARCSECMEPFDEGDKVIVISDGIVNNDGNIELSDIVYFIKPKVIRDFLTRFIDVLETIPTNLPKNSIDKSAEEIVNDSEKP